MLGNRSKLQQLCPVRIFRQQRPTFQYAFKTAHWYIFAPFKSFQLLIHIYQMKFTNIVVIFFLILYRLFLLT
jgi:hypothetical protein